MAKIDLKGTALEMAHERIAALEDGLKGMEKLAKEVMKGCGDQATRAEAVEEKWMKYRVGMQKAEAERNTAIKELSAMATARFHGG